MLRRASPLLALLAALIAAAPAQGAVDARLEGVLQMDGRITVARGVPGERAGQRIRRTWRVDSTCPLGPCPTVALRRGRARGESRLVLSRRAPGVYAGRGSFTIPVRCAGRRLPRGGLALFSITLTVTAAQTVQTTPFATAVSARYDNGRRINRTLCPGGLGREAATYLGARTGGLPTPPLPDFSTQIIDRRGRVAEFTASAPDARIVAFDWDFGDPASGTANSARGPLVSHAFSGFGPFFVTLAALDGNGLLGVAVHRVGFF